MRSAQDRDVPEVRGVPEAVAIIGAGCRFPHGVGGLPEFWNLLRDKVDAIGEVPPQRWDLERFYDPEPGKRGTMYTRRGGFLDGVDQFDPAFFGIAPREANEMDPQQRLLLEVAWEALEDAGQATADLAGTRTAVYTGVIGSDYTLLHSKESGTEGIDAWYASGREFSFGPGRLSHLLGVHGPSLSVNTACSSSLVAVHLACQSLLGGESDLALAGGVNLILSPELSIFMSKVRAMSRQGHCKPFDASADGIVRGEGCGLVALKRLSDARADGDDVLAVIRGTAVNHDGASAGLTVPNGVAQQRLLREAAARAGVDPADIGYVEAHGTGTPLGDPIEMSALRGVLGAGRPAERPLFVGSLKGNLGHMDSAAGIAGLLKTALILKHGEIPANLHLTTPNPLIRWDWPVVVPTESTPWPADGAAEAADGPARPRLAGVSAFGLSGTNAHLILEAAAPRTDDRPATAGPVLLPLSARSGDALTELARTYREHLTGGPATPLRDLAHTLGAGRAHHREHRLTVSGDSREQLAERLGAYLEGAPAAGLSSGGTDEEREPRIVFTFSGQGSQWPGMGRGLLARQPVFREAFDACDALIRAQAGWSAADELAAEAPHSRLARTEYAQPVIFALQVSLAALWRSWGVEPAAVVGHSMGEVAAAHVAGVLELADAVRIIVHRGELLADSAGQGAMASVDLSEAHTRASLEPYADRLWIAACNSARSTVVSGDAAALEEWARGIQQRGTSCRVLPGDYPFHSPLMAPYQERMAALLAGLRPRPATVPILTTTLLAEEDAFTADYWARNVREPVGFAAAVDALLADGHDTFVELGPHPVLSVPLAHAFDDHEVGHPLVVPSLRRDTDAADTLLGSLGALYAAGAPVRWRAVGPPDGRPVKLPGYPWQRKRYWMKPAAPRQRTGPESAPAAGGAPAPAPQGALRGELRVYDEHGRVVGEATDLRLDLPGTGTGAGSAPRAAAASGAADQPARSAPADQLSPPADQQPAAGHRDLEDLVARVVAQVLGHDPATLRRRQGFTDLGMDSLTALEVRTLLQHEVGRLPATVAFDHPTVERLAAFLRERAPKPAPAAGQGPAPRSVPAGAAAPFGQAAPAAPEPIAVIGVGCRFPGGATGPAAYWRMLQEGTDAITESPEGRFDDGSRWRGAWLDQVDHFDAQFFRIPPREARVMDPQQRLFLQVAWEALEHAGQPADRLTGSRTGVFVGMNSHDYVELIANAPENIDAFYGTGNSFCSTSGRLSYFLGARGPSLAVDTACSSSLVATHLAVRSLRSGESDLALAGGVNVILRPTIHLASQAAGALAADGRCKTFDAAADGYTRGEGCGVVVLKPLSRALADGDEVLATILGSAVNQDGPSSGLTVPNGPAQESLIRDALADADVGPADVGYVEAHGTGTPLGDPIELQALGAALGERPDGAPAAVGSVKTNFGHLEAASGVAGLIKTVLSLRHQEIPPHLHFREPSPEIPWAQLPFEVPTARTPWPRGERRRVAGVSAFGFSGTNAHLVLGEAPPRTAPAAGAAGTADAADGAEGAPGGAYLLPLSASSASALPAQAAAYRRLLTEPAAPAADPAAPAAADPPHDLCFTASTRRTHLGHRVAVVGRTRAELAERLAAFEAGERALGLSTGAVPGGADRRPVFVFSGHGSQWPGMARRLLAEDPVFRAVMVWCDGHLRPELGWSVLDHLERGEPAPDGPRQQELIFAVQVALARRWRSLGVEPAAVVGHSMGEVAAAQAAGVLTIEDAARLIRVRAAVQAQLVGSGAMGVLGLTVEQTEAVLEGYEDRLWVALSNSERTTVVSGEEAALTEVLAACRARNVFSRRIDAAGAGHCPLVEPLDRELTESLRWLRPRKAELPLYSSVTGGLLAGEAHDAAYWGRNLRDRVRFSTAIGQLAQEGHDTFIEISPDPLLLTSIEQDLRQRGTDAVLVPSLRRDTDDLTVMLGSLGTLHCAGYPVDWARLYPGGGRVVETPSYAWQGRRHWLSSGDSAGTGTAAWAPAAGRHPLLARRVRAVRGAGMRLYEADLHAALLDALPAGRLWGSRLVPGAAWLEMALAAGRERLGAGPLALADVSLHPPLLLDGDGDGHDGAAVPTAQLTLERDAGSRGDRGADRFTVHTYPAADGAADGEEAVLRADGRLTGAAPADAEPWGAPAVTAALPPAEVADLLASSGVCTQRLRVRSAARGDGACTVELEREPAAGPVPRWALEPGLLEACLHTLALAADGSERGGPLLPLAVERLVLLREPGPRLTVRAKLTGTADGRMCGDVQLLCADGTVAAVLTGVVLGGPPVVPVPPETRARLDRLLYTQEWLPCPPPAQFPAANTPAANTPAADGTWLLLADEGGVAEALAAQLRARGGRPVLVTRQEAADPAGLAKLAHETVRGPGCRGAVHLWALDLPAETGAGGGSGAEAVPEAGAQVYDAVLTLARALGTGRAVRPTWYLTRGARATGTGPEPVAAAQTPVWSLAKVAAMEHPNAWGGLLDLDPAAAGGASAADAEAAAVLERLLSDDGQDQLAVRDGRRIIPRVVRRPAAPRVGTPGSGRRGGAYVVAEGADGLGLHVARWLVGRGAERVVLSHTDEHPSRDREFTSELAALRRTGAEVRTLRCDPADRTGAAALLADARADGMPLRGVLWLAVDWELGDTAEVGPEQLTEAVHRRARGSRHLDELCRGADLDLFVVFGGIASDWGSLGVARQAPADALLAALAHRRRARGEHALCVRWAPWDEVGLLSGATRSMMVRAGLEPLPPEAAIEALDHLVAADAVEAGVCRVDWGIMLPLYRQTGWPLFDALEAGGDPDGEAAVDALRAQLAALPDEERHRSLVGQVLTETAVVLGAESADELETRQGFFDLGMNSITALEMKVRLERRFGCVLPNTLAFEYPNAEALAGYLAADVLGLTPSAPPAPTAAPPGPAARDDSAAAQDDLTARFEREMAAVEHLAAPAHLEQQDTAERRKQ
uniref:Polyketide synthase type 1 n=1 Tax=Streptomyces sp. CNH287 TaxID=1288082 RepID=U6A471_9ACTN|nr:polyketide synthase type 1 [Streptomyces sp. CNH287]